MRLREWWGAYLLSPLATIAGVALYVAVSVLSVPPFALSTLGATFGYMAVVGVGISYLVGLLLLPLFLVFEAFGWRGWRVYVPTGLVAGLLVTIQIGGADTRAPHAFVLCATCGALCAWVFSVRMSRAQT